MMTQQGRFPIIVFAFIGMALVLFSYLAAGGRDRNDYFPDPSYSCELNWYSSSATNGDKFWDYGLLWCLPPYYYVLYTTAILGVTLCVWSLVLRRKMIFHRDRVPKEKLGTETGAVIASVLMIVLGIHLIDLEVLWFFNIVAVSQDIFGLLGRFLVIIGLLYFTCAVRWRRVRNQKDHV